MSSPNTSTQRAVRTTARCAQPYLVRTGAPAYLVGAVPRLAVPRQPPRPERHRRPNPVALGATVVLPSILLPGTIRGIPDL
jgi:hypothetical protein